MPACARCDAPLGEGVAFCGCGALQPPPRGRDAFAVLGVEKRWDLDASALEKRHKELSRKLHPDRFAKADPRERRHSLEWATQVNDAYKLLRDPLRRAEYLLRLQGIDVTDERRTVADPEFLTEVLEQREALADARGQGDTTRLEAMGQEARGRRQAEMARLAQAFGAGALAEAARAVVALRYYDRFLEELEAPHAA